MNVGRRAMLAKIAGAVAAACIPVVAKSHPVVEFAGKINTAPILPGHWGDDFVLVRIARRTFGGDGYFVEPVTPDERWVDTPGVVYNIAEQDGRRFLPDGHYALARGHATGRFIGVICEFEYERRSA